MTIDLDHIPGILADNYGITVTNVTSVPSGAVALGYRIDCTDDHAYFLKVWPANTVGKDATQHLSRVLSLLLTLRNTGVYEYVSAPILTTNGDLWKKIDGETFALSPFIGGNHPPAEGQTTCSQLAGALAKVHQGSNRIDISLPVEEFDISVTSKLRDALKTIEQIGDSDRSGLRQLRNHIIGRRDELISLADRLEGLAHVVAQLSSRQVICHTDIKSDNVLVNDGNVYLLDWDDARLAPPEYDFPEAPGDDFASYVSAYLSAGGIQQLHIEHFAFQLLRRNIGDGLFRIEQILNENTSEEEDAMSMYGLDAYGFARWERLDEHLASITHVLST